MIVVTFPLRASFLLAASLVGTGCASRAVPEDVRDVALSPTPCGTQTCASGMLCVHRTNVGGTATIATTPNGCPDGSVPSRVQGFCSPYSESWECASGAVICGGVECARDGTTVGDACACAPMDAASTLGCGCGGN